VSASAQGAAASLRLAAPDTFAYLRCSACYTIDDVDDRDEFKVWPGAGQRERERDQRESRERERERESREREREIKSDSQPSLITEIISFHLAPQKPDTKTNFRVEHQQ
jgi:hypothetical protein